MHIFIYICVGLMLLFGAAAVMFDSIIRSAAALAAASASLAVAMYLMGATWAAVFELSVCTGLVTVVFISAISLSHRNLDQVRKPFQLNPGNYALPLALIILGGVLVGGALLLKPETPELADTFTDSFRHVFWELRQPDIWGQIAVILCGGIAVAVLFREGKK